MSKSIPENVLPRLHDLFLSCAGDGCTSVTVKALPASGSDRRYWRLVTWKGEQQLSALGAWNPNHDENHAFLTYARHFHSLGHPVPEVYLVDDDDDDDDSCVYLQEDLGSETLLQRLNSLRAAENSADACIVPHSAIVLYQQALAALARLQIQGGKGLTYEGVAFPSTEFGAQRMLWDLNYFKYCFLKLSSIDFDEQQLESDFRAFAEYLLDDDCEHFLFRDFQSRNIMILDDAPYFIDFQGGCRGALQYDAASLLFQAKAQLPPETRVELFEYYMDEVSKLKVIHRDSFRNRFSGYVLLRQLQTLGAYGFRGLHERRPHFLESIPLALRNVAWVLDNMELPVKLPELEKVLRRLPQSAKLAPLFRPIVPKSNARPLEVTVSSFAYKGGLPEDSSGHGGGFIFDCRGLNNPGRLQQFKYRTGNDPVVQDFLRRESRVSEFLKAAQDSVDITLRNFLERGFSSLMVSFGCTGGQHRSVYCANELREWLTGHFPVKVNLCHRELQTRMRKALILAGGLGTRLRPLTDSRPKALVEVSGVPLLELQILRLKFLGFEDITVAVHHYADMIEEFLESKQNFGITIHISNELGQQLDTGGALFHSKQFLDGDAPFYVCNVDVLTDLDPHELEAAHLRTTGALATLAVRKRTTSRYFCFDNDSSQLTGWRNVTTDAVKGTPDKDDTLYAFSGLHIIDPRIFQESNRTGAFSIVDLYLDLMQSHTIVGYVHQESSWMDVGRVEHLAQANDLARNILDGP